MSTDSAFEKLIVENVIKELARKGMLDSGGAAQQPLTQPPAVSDDQAISLPCLLMCGSSR